MSNAWEEVSETWDDVIEGSKQIGEKIGWGSAGIKSDKTQSAANRARKAAEANRPRRAPSLDDARAGQLENDRVRRRKGVLADIYGGANANSPTVAVKQLLGS
jgi:hypothetical protein